MSDDTCCSIGDCDRPSRKRGLCAGHYQRLRAGKPLDGPLRSKLRNGEKPPPCSVDGCGRPVRYRQLCGTHYERERTGQLLTPVRALASRTGTCSAGDCDREIWATGLCAAHYMRGRAGSAAEGPIRAQSAIPADGPIRSQIPRTGPCTVPGCDREMFASGMCAAHSVRARTGISMDKPIRPRRRNDEPDAVCSADGCDKLAKGGFGWCKSHWATLTGKGAEYSATRRTRKFDGPHDKITAADLRRIRAETDDCYLCEKPLEDPVEFDHVIPLVRGGRHVLSNLRATHRHCNRVKHARLLAVEEVS